MKEELELKLQKQFPWFVQQDMWADNSKEDNETFPPYCAFRDGWFDLMFNLLSEIDDLYYDLDIPIEIVFYQIKEKYGTLRFYIGNYIDGVNDIVNKYENMSYSTCEVCGNVGILYNDGWCRVRCGKCENGGKYEN